MARPTFTAASVALMALFAFAPAQAAAQGTVIFQSGQPERGYQSAPHYSGDHRTAATAP